MYKIPLTELKEKIRKEKGLSVEELDDRIHKKINELSGLIFIIVNGWTMGTGEIFYRYCEV